MKPDGWQITNFRERHYRIGGRIVGKLDRPSGETAWTMYVYRRKRRSGRMVIGWRKDEEAAKQRVEEAVARLWAKPMRGDVLTRA